MLEKCYKRGKKSSVKLQTLGKQFKLLQMDNKESINDYFTKVLSLTYQIKTNGDKIIDQTIIENILRTLPQKFDNILVAIEESKDLSNMTIDEL